jgi:hypothetical protein
MHHLTPRAPRTRYVAKITRVMRARYRISSCSRSRWVIGAGLRPGAQSRRISSPDLGVFAVTAAGVLCAFPGVVGAYLNSVYAASLAHISLSMPLLELSGYGWSVVRLQCLRRRRPGQVRCRQG